MRDLWDSLRTITGDGSCSMSYDGAAASDEYVWSVVVYAKHPPDSFGFWKKRGYGATDAAAFYNMTQQTWEWCWFVHIGQDIRLPHNMLLHPEAQPPQPAA